VLRVRLVDRPTPAQRAPIDRFLDEAARTLGAPPLSDHLRLDLANGGAPGFVAAIAVGSDDGDHELGHPVGYAQGSAGNDSTSIEVVVHPDAGERYAEIAAALLTAVLDAVAGPVYWWVHGAGEVHDRVAAAAGLVADRRLLQLRRTLPTGLDAGVSTRPFVVGADEDAWLQVNNRAFAWHPEQGGWDRATLEAREAEPWFDPDGFLLHERDARLAGFCWTKLHPATALDPELGEIYVIAVDPDFVGLGLGRSLTLAGLEAIAARGVTTGMLFVDAGNEPAVGLYTKLGFDTHRVDVAYRRGS
jgi:mycothiol synthase